MRYLGVSIAAGVCLLAAGAANAEERLADADLDRVVAGVDLADATIQELLSDLTLENNLRDAAFILGSSLESEFGEALDEEPVVGNLVTQLIIFGDDSPPPPTEELGALDPGTLTPRTPIEFDGQLLFTGSLLEVQPELD